MSLTTAIPCPHNVRTLVYSEALEAWTHECLGCGAVRVPEGHPHLDALLADALTPEAVIAGHMRTRTPEERVAFTVATHVRRAGL